MNKYPLNIHFINKISAVFQEIEHGGNPYLAWTDSLDKADVIMFEAQTPAQIRGSVEFRKYPQKCIAVTADDRPHYFLPGCYSSNSKSFFTRKRTRTIPYIRMRREGPNNFIKSFINEPYRYLFSFKGGSTSWIRKKIFKVLQSKSDVYISASNDYVHFSLEATYQDRKAQQQAEYAELLKDSLFFLCPRGAGCGSIRLFEVMEAGRVPVIIADAWEPIQGVDWENCSLRVAETDVEKLDAIIRANQERGLELAHNALKAYQKQLAPGPDLKLLADLITEVQANRNENREKLMRLIIPIFWFFKNIKGYGYNSLRWIVLKVFGLLGKKVPYSMNRS